MTIFKIPYKKPHNNVFQWNKNLRHKCIAHLKVSFWPKFHKTSRSQTVYEAVFTKASEIWTIMKFKLKKY